MAWTHYFDESHAKEWGVDVAIMIAEVRQWARHNLASNRNQIDGHTWVYNSARAWAELLPFWTPSKAYRILASLVEAGVLITGNYNKMPYDRTLWYAFADEDLFLEGLANTALPKRGTVYLVRRADGAVKIGISATPKARISRLRKQYEGLTVLAGIEVDGYRLHERKLHRLYEDDAIGGEWFRLTDGQVTQAIDSLLQAGGNHFPSVEDESSTEVEPIPSSPPSPQHIKRSSTSPTLSFNWTTREWVGLTDEQVAVWQEAYPACDIRLELAQAKAWIIANPDKGHKQRWARFVTNWLKRSQDRGGTRSGGFRAARAAPRPVRDEDYGTMPERLFSDEEVAAV